MRCRTVDWKPFRIRPLFRRLSFVWLALLMGLTPALTQTVAAKHGPSFDHVVYPTGTFPTDTDAVQAAVSQGGSVLLKATNSSGAPTAFNFGPADVSNDDGGVYLAGDVQVVGERLGDTRTTIDGGVVPFRGWIPDHSGQYLDLSATISGIDFEAPLLSAVIIDWSSGSQIVGNRINNVQGVAGCYDQACNYTFVEGRAIKFLGNDDPQHAITGNVVISNNEIVNSNAELSAAITLDSVAANVTIQNNVITTNQEAGMFLIDSSGHVTISDNTIMPGPGDGSPDSLGNGMYILDVSGAGGRYIITNNTLDIANPNADGIILDGYGAINHAVLTNNKITLHDTYYGAISLFQNVSHAQVANNQILGSGAFGLDIMEYDAGSNAVSNDFRNNDLSHFDASVADVFLADNTSNTIVNGDVDSVVDLGINNHWVARSNKSAWGAEQVERSRWENHARGSEHRQGWTTIPNHR